MLMLAAKPGIDPASLWPSSRRKAASKTAHAPGSRRPRRARAARGRKSQARPGRASHPHALAAARAKEAKSTKVDRSKYETVRDLKRLEAWVAKARDAGLVAVDTETTSLDAMRADLVGVSLALSPNEACYIPLGHRTDGDLLSGGGLVPGQIPIRDALKVLKPDARG